MKGKCFFVVLLIFVTVVFTTCNPAAPNTTANNTPKTWSWTEGAFSLEINGSGDTLKTGDTFSMSLLGYGTITGTIEYQQNNGARGMSVEKPGGGGMWFKPPSGEKIDGEYNGGTIIIGDKKLPFSWQEKDFAAALAPDGIITSVQLPAPVGSDAIGGKTYYLGTQAFWKFNFADRTYQLASGGDWTDIYHTGKYTWNSEKKLVMLIPEMKMPIDDNYTPIDGNEDRLIDKDEFLTSFKGFLADRGITESNVSTLYGGKFKTLDDLYIAVVNQNFGLQLYSYSTDNNGFITDFTRRLATTLEVNEINKTIGGCPYSDTEIAHVGNKHYLLSIGYEAAKTQLSTFLGTNYWEGNSIQSGSSMSQIGNAVIGKVIFEDCVIFNSYRLVRYVEYEDGEYWWGIEWTRLNF